MKGIIISMGRSESDYLITDTRTHTNTLGHTWTHADTLYKRGLTWTHAGGYMRNVWTHALTRDIREHKLTHTDTRGHTWTHANTCEHTWTYADKRGHTGHTRTHADTR